MTGLIDVIEGPTPPVFVVSDGRGRELLRMTSDTGRLVATYDPVDVDEAAARFVVAVGRVFSPLLVPGCGPYCVPEAFGSEDGDRWWLKGHVDPQQALLAVFLEEAHNVDMETALEFLLGGRTYSTETKGPVDPSWGEIVATAKDVRGVSHYWARQDPDDEERMLPCDEGDAGAEPWTEVTR